MCRAEAEVVRIFFFPPAGIHWLVAILFMLSGIGIPTPEATSRDLTGQLILTSHHVANVMLLSAQQPLHRLSLSTFEFLCAQKHTTFERCK